MECLGELGVKSLPGNSCSSTRQVRSGEGLPGDSLMSGKFLTKEIYVRATADMVVDDGARLCLCVMRDHFCLLGVHREQK